ncbi:muramoyltetrapeptide carboxypeptidase [Desulfitispora alkaliphila]|uniref:S66 peptidase family protein n=1 Tax=Desulfitispora alkaliphila TaxID=622674 RepID=UPI003D22B226
MKIKPKALKPGDTVSLVAPASYANSPSAIYFCKAALEDLGYRVIEGKSLNKRWGYLAGTDEERLNDLMDAFQNPNINGIFCLRGGYGSMRLLSMLDYNLIKANPKVFVGFSDITAMQLAIYRETGLVTFHGPVVNSLVRNKEAGTYSVENLHRATTSSKPLGKIKNPEKGHYVVALNGGVASGDLVGGNLSLICATLGTPYEIDTTNKILFLEEVGEEPYRIDRMLTQLELAGKLKDIAGLIVGESVNCRPREYMPSFSSTFNIEEILVQKVEKLNVPAIYGMTIGHGKHQATLPLGVKATLDADQGHLLIRESAVVNSY